jgi:hypothetical protein
MSQVRSRRRSALSRPLGTIAGASRLLTAYPQTALREASITKRPQNIPAEILALGPSCVSPNLAA